MMKFMQSWVFNAREFKDGVSGHLPRALKIARIANDLGLRNQVEHSSDIG